MKANCVGDRDVFETNQISRIVSHHIDAFDDENLQTVVVADGGEHMDKLARFFEVLTDPMEKLRSICLQCNSPGNVTEDSTLTKPTLSTSLCSLSTEFSGNKSSSSQTSKTEETTCVDFYMEQFLKSHEPSDIDVIHKNSRMLLFEKKKKVLPFLPTAPKRDTFTSNSVDEVGSDARIACIIEKIRTTGLSKLLWHPANGIILNSGAFNDCPTASAAMTMEVTLRFKKGIISSNSILTPPRLVLDYVHDEKAVKKRQIQRLQQNAPYCIELWEVTKIFDLENSPFKIFSFAMLHSSFAIVTFHNFFVFEATDRDERNRSVLILKTIVAKFAQDPMNDALFGTVPDEDFHSTTGAIAAGRSYKCNSESDEDITMSIQRSCAVDEYD